MRDALTTVVVLAAIGQIGWCITYATSPWRQTPIGWVWLFKGGTLAVLLTLLVVDRVYHDLPNTVWVVAMFVLTAAIWTWWVATIRAKRGRFNQEN